MARSRKTVINLHSERATLLRSLLAAERNWFAMCRNFRDAGTAWNRIKVACKERGISVAQWANDNSHLSKRWLDKYGEFASRWDEFLACWNWARSQPYTPERRPGLWACFDLMDAKKRFDTYEQSHHAAGARQALGTTVPKAPANLAPPIGDNPIHLTRTAALYQGDVTGIMRGHIASASIDLAISDPPFFLRRPDQPGIVDQLMMHNGMRAAFNEPWDKFASIEEYESFTAAWLDEAMRCLNDEGSLFIFGTFHNIGLINRIAQLRGYVILNELIWVLRNSRPHLAKRRLQASHQNILWIAKNFDACRFNYAACKRAHDPDDFLSAANTQARDVMDIPTAGHENRTGFPAPKPLAVYERLLRIAGKPSGRLLDLFSGSGTGIVAAMRWGMESISVERDPNYVADICQRVDTERSRRSPTIRATRHQVAV
jgi:site-specific DNA-methyltransferase (adenine-specific)